MMTAYFSSFLLADVHFNSSAMRISSFIAD